MRISKLFLIALLAGTSASQLQAQTASPELQQKALELLRQTMSQPASTPAQSVQPAQSQRPPAVTRVQRPPTTPPAQSSTVRSMSPSTEQRALERLRREMATQETPAPTPGQVSTKVSAPTTKQPVQPRVKTPAPAQRPSAPQMTSPRTQGTNTVSRGVTQPSGTAKTKQERLADLLERYRADELTPAQYQVERAKILAEP